ncbi:MAG: hypothetical protein NC218_02510 [Acetobacter sp.]|nr:hypothetical protein [Acetobacter sp.]
MSMNTQKILELLGTTSAQKMETLRRQESFPVCAEESANEMLNAELFGTTKPRVDGKAPARKAASESTKVRLKKVVKKAEEDVEDEFPPAPVEEPVAAPVDAVAAEPDGMVGDLRCYDAVNDEGNVACYFDYDPTVLPEERAAEIMTQLEGQGLTLESAVIEEGADEAVATEGLKRRCGSQECLHTEAAPAAAATEKETAEEMVVEASGKFPENFTFDEAAFADEYGIDSENLSVIYVPEDPDAQVAEHIEVSFDYEESKVILSISADNTVSETVDAEEVEPQFAASFIQQENADGVMEDILVLDLIEEEGADDTIKSEEDSQTKSEGDEKHEDEDGKGSTDEFIEEAGLDLDGFYADQKGMKKADKSVHEVKPAGNATESLAAKIIRTRK